MYLTKIISLSLEIPFEYVKDNLKMIHPSIATNNENVKSKADLVYELPQEENGCYISIELNRKETKKSIIKNYIYYLHLNLRQVKSSKEYIDLSTVYQININGYDIYGYNKFMYVSEMQEKELHKRRPYTTGKIIDINLAYLAKLSYNEIVRSKSKLEKYLYLFVEDNEEELKKLYEGEEFMAELQKEIDSYLGEDDAILFYDADKFREDEYKELLEEGLKEGIEKGLKQGLEQGLKQSQTETVKKMLEINMSDDVIIKCTGITKKELEKLKMNN